MIVIKDFDMPSCCAECDFRKSDPFSGEVYCNRLSSDKNIVIYEDERLENCPLVEIEPLTDSEQRIFLSAMSREERICKELDSEKVDDGSIKKLVPIVNSIKRKVKKTLWG